MRFLDSILKLRLRLVYKDEETDDEPTDHYLYFNAFINTLEETFQPKYVISADAQANSGEVKGFMQSPSRQFNININLLAESDTESYRNYIKLQTIKSYLLSLGDVYTNLSKAIDGGDRERLTALFTNEASSYILFPPITNSEEEKFIMNAFAFKPIEDFGYIVYPVKGGETLIAKAYTLNLGGILDSTRKQRFKIGPVERALIDESKLSGVKTTGAKPATATPASKETPKKPGTRGSGGTGLRGGG